MTTTTLDTGLVRSRINWARLLAPIAGLALVAGMVGLFVSPAGDDTGETPAEVVAYAQSHEAWTVA